MIWVLLSIAATISLAAFQLTNQYAKVDGFDLAVMVKVVLVILFLPFTLYFGWPQEPLFYLFVGATAPLVLYGDKLFFDLAAEYGAGVISRIVPLNLILLFVGWLVVQPSLAMEYFSEPIIFSGIILALCSTIYFAMRMRKCEISAAAFKKAIPILLIWAIVPIFNKQAMDHSGLHEGVYVYGCFQAFLVALIGLPMIGHRRLKSGKAFISARLLKTSFIAALAVTLHLIAKNYSYALVDDPTFPTAILLTSPLFILAYYRLTNHKEDADIWSGIGVVASVMALVVLKGI